MKSKIIEKHSTTNNSIPEKEKPSSVDKKNASENKDKEKDKDDKLKKNISNTSIEKNKILISNLESNKKKLNYNEIFTIENRKEKLWSYCNDINFQKALLSNNSLIKSIKENDNKNITLNLKIEMNLNLGEKSVINPGENFNMTKPSKSESNNNSSSSNNNKGKKETDIYINIPINNDLKVTSNEELRGLYNKICDDLVLQIKENQQNDKPQVNGYDSFHNNCLFNIETLCFSYDYEKKRNNKIESQCLLEFLNFIDFNLKNTFMKNSEASKLYCKYDFLAENLIDNEIFHNILKGEDYKDCAPSNSVDNLHGESNSNNNNNINSNNQSSNNINQNKDYLFSTSINMSNINNDYNNKIIQLNKNNSNNNTYNNFVTSRFDNISGVNIQKPKNNNSINANNITSNVKKNSLVNFKSEKTTNTKANNIANLNAKEIKANNSNNALKTTINSQDIDIINDLKSFKGNIHSGCNNNNSQFMKNYVINNGSNNSIRYKANEPKSYNNNFEKFNSQVSKVFEHTNNFAEQKNFILSHKLQEQRANHTSVKDFKSSIVDLQANCISYTEKMPNQDINNNFTDQGKYELNQGVLINAKNYHARSNSKNNNNNNHQGSLSEQKPDLLNHKKHRELSDDKSLQNDSNSIILSQSDAAIKKHDAANSDLSELSKNRRSLGTIVLGANEQDLSLNELNNSDILNNNNIQQMKSKENSRKSKNDSIHKKIKVNILKYLREFISQNVSFTRIPNLSQEIVTNINISFNKDLLEKKLIDIYQEDFSKCCQESIDAIWKAMETNESFNQIMHLPLKEFISSQYWNSEFHAKKLQKIQENETIEYYQSYVNLDQEFINYYLNSRVIKKKD